MLKKIQNWLYSLMISLFISACGGASGGGSSVAGIDGSGDGDDTVSRTTSIGSVNNEGNNNTIVINDTEYDTSVVNITFDGESVTSDQLSLGQVVIANGEHDAAIESLQATDISYTSNVIGPIGIIDTANLSIGILGQRIFIDGNTVFGDELVGFTDFVHQQVLRVSGFVNSQGDIIATRIDQLSVATTYQVVGIVEELDMTEMTFNINNLVVNYQTATIDNLQEGNVVKVNGSQLDNKGVLQAEMIEPISNVLNNAGQSVDIGGLITRFESPWRLVVYIQPGRVQAGLV